MATKLCPWFTKYLLLCFVLLHNQPPACQASKGRNLGAKSRAGSPTGHSDSWGGSGGVGNRMSVYGGQLYGDGSCAPDGTGEKAVKRYVLCGYDRTSRPVISDNSTINVTLAVTLFHILDTDEKHQTLTALLSIRMRWVDEYLNWDPELFNGTKTMHLPASSIWTPDVVISNSADESMKGYMGTNTIVQSDGTILWMVPALVKVTCTLNVKYFPFDHQSCLLTFISWTYNGHEIDIIYNPDVDANKNYYNAKNQEWNVSKITARRNEKIYACCPEPYPDVTITVHISRRSLFYVFNLIFPCLLMYMASFLGFFLPIESGEKVNLELTILLALVVFLLIIGETLPPTPDALPLLGLLFGVTMVMVLVALLMGVIVTNCHVRKYTSTQIPWILRFYIRYFHCSRHKYLNKATIVDKPIPATPSHPSKSTPKYNNSLHPSDKVPTSNSCCGFDCVQAVKKRFFSTVSSHQRRKDVVCGVRLNDAIIKVKYANERGLRTPIDRYMRNNYDDNAEGGTGEINVVGMLSEDNKTSTSVLQGNGHAGNGPTVSCPLTASHLSLSDYEDSPFDRRVDHARRASFFQGIPPNNAVCICNDPESWVLIARLLDRVFFWLFLLKSIVVLGWIFYSIPPTPV